MPRSNFQAQLLSYLLHTDNWVSLTELSTVIRANNSITKRAVDRLVDRGILEAKVEQNDF